MTKYKVEFYNRVCAPENEHSVIEVLMQSYAYIMDIELVYYREIENEHRSCWREFKIISTSGNVHKFCEQFKNQIDNSWLKKNQNELNQSK